MPLSTAALATELNTDPAALGYAPLIAAGDDAGCAALVNAPTATLIFRNDMTSREIINTIVPADFAAMTDLQFTKLNALFMQNPTIDATSANMQAIFLGIFTGMGDTVNALAAVAQRPGTRAEILGGIGTRVTQADVSLALRGS